MTWFVVIYVFPWLKWNLRGYFENCVENDLVRGYFHFPVVKMESAWLFQELRGECPGSWLYTVSRG